MARFCNYTALFSGSHGLDRYYGRRNYPRFVHFCARGFFVSIVGLDEAMVRAYIRHQEEEDGRYEQRKMGL